MTRFTSLLLIFGAVTLEGCALNIQTYPGSARPADQVATLRPLSAQILSVDGATVKNQCGGQEFLNCKVFLLPGLHSIQIQPLSVTGDESLMYVPSTVATPDMYVESPSYYAPDGNTTTVTYEFLPGHSYSLFSSKDGSSLFDETIRHTVNQSPKF